MLGEKCEWDCGEGINGGQGQPGSGRSHALYKGQRRKDGEGLRGGQRRGRGREEARGANSGVTEERTLPYGEWLCCLKSG